MNFIKDLKESQELDECYLIQTKNVYIDKNGKSYVALVLKDKTGTIDSRIWNCDLEKIKSINENDFIKVVGTVHIYNNELQLSIKKFELEDINNVNKFDYIPSSPKEIDKMIDELYQVIDGVKNENLKWLLEKLFLEDENMIKVFSEKSAAKSVHHNYLGGLLEHSLNVTFLAQQAARRYEGTIDYDLITTVAILHDIGKIIEFSNFPENDYTEEGKLLGHIILGAQIVNDAINQNKEFPHELKNRIEHAILSHHGEYEYGSPKRPKTIEALIIHYCDNLDAKVNTFMHALETSLNEEIGWTDYNKYFGRQLKK